MEARMTWKRESNDKPALAKSAVIGIAVAVIVVVLAVIGGIAFWLIRRRRNKNTGSSGELKHGTPRVVDEDDFSQLNERSSKVPLIRHDDESQMTELRHSMSRYDENDEHAPLAMPHRAHSDASGHSNHRPKSSMGGSGGGLRQLNLVHAHRDDDVHPSQTSPERHDHHRNRLSIRLPAHGPVHGLPSPGRPRSHSRFREGDV